MMLRILFVAMAFSISSSITFANVCVTDGTNVNCNSNFEELTNNLFKESIQTVLPLNISEDLYSPIQGEKFLYCSILSDHIYLSKEAEFFYDKGMALLEGYTKKYAVRDVKSYEDLRNINPVTSNIPFFHQAFTIDNKDVLKGVVFESIARIIREEESERPNNINLKISFTKNCEPLLKTDMG